MMRIKFKKLTTEAKEPFRVYDVDAGFDLFAISKEETKDYIEYKTGIAFEIPEEYVGLIFPRSSITKYDLMLKNSVGIIDASYRGEILFRFAKVINEIFSEYNYGENNNNLNANKIVTRKSKYYEIGERVGQIVFMPIPKVILIESEELSETQRGENGFGSTNNN